MRKRRKRGEASCEGLLLMYITALLRSEGDRRFQSRRMPRWGLVLWSVCAHRHFWEWLRSGVRGSPVELRSASASVGPAPWPRVAEAAPGLSPSQYTHTGMSITRRKSLIIKTEQTHTLSKKFKQTKTIKSHQFQTYSVTILYYKRMWYSWSR